MAEYIDRGDLTIWLNKKSCEFSMNDVAPIGWTLKGLVNELATFPSADVVERKTGKWMLPNNEVAVYLNEWICSACNYLIDGKHNFCPNCGAKMIGGDDDV